MRSLALAAAVIVIGGCGGATLVPPPDAAADGGGVGVMLGGAAMDGSGFLPLAGDLTLVSGAQGGFHVWMKYRLTGVAPGTVAIAYNARRVSDNHLILMSTPRQQEVGAPGDAGYWELPTAIPAFMCPSPLGVQVRDEVIRLQVNVSTTGGAPLGSAEAEYTPRCPEGDQNGNCINICSG